MCIVTAEELEAEREYWIEVSKTSIFARISRPGHQVLAYSMSIASKSAAAMILPVPVCPGSGDDALRFIDLSGYPDFFEVMAAACKTEHRESVETLYFDDLAGASDAPLLTVHQVGDFEASYVPTMEDFSRLDPRFRLPDRLWGEMRYADYGFAVFQLALALTQDSDAAMENDIHPMAFEFPTRDPSRLYFPTVHVHDGTYNESASFHHKLFCQRDNARSEFKYQRDLLEGDEPTPAKNFDSPLFDGYYWYSRSNEFAYHVMPVDRCEGLLDPERELHAMSLVGDYPNRDIWLGDSL